MSFVIQYIPFSMGSIVFFGLFAGSDHARILCIRPAFDAFHLRVAGIPDDHNVAVLPTVALHQPVNLQHKRAGRVHDGKTKRLYFLTDTSPRRVPG